jgi:hypothetical protein
MYSTVQDGGSKFQEGGSKFLDGGSTVRSVGLVYISMLLQGPVQNSVMFGGYRVDTKWRFQYFAKYDYRFLLDVIIPIITTFFAKAIIAISRLSLSILLE